MIGDETGQPFPYTPPLSSLDMTTDVAPYQGCEYGPSLYRNFLFNSCTRRHEYFSHAWSSSSSAQIDNVVNSLNHLLLSFDDMFTKNRIHYKFEISFN